MFCMCSCFLGLGFRVCLCTHAYYMRTHTQSMRTHTTRLCTQALCMRTHTHAQKPYSEPFFASVSLFYLYNMPLPCLVLCL